LEKKTKARIFKVAWQKRRASINLFPFTDFFFSFAQRGDWIGIARHASSLLTYMSVLAIEIREELKRIC
jgi:hypothetical protein